MAVSAELKFAGFKLLKLARIAVLCLVSLSLANAASAQNPKKAKKQQPPPPPLPSGPTGPIQSQVPLDAIAPVPPQVVYQNGELTIVAPNSTLGDILRAVRKQTGAEIEIPDAKERVVTRLGPGPAREVMVELLNGSRFNYVLLGSAQDASALTRVVLVAKTGDITTDNSRPAQPGQPPVNEAANRGDQAPPPEVSDAEVPEENVEDNAEQPPPEAEQPATPADQPEVKTPQQMLQEMQQRQLQMQQQLQQHQQPPGQPPSPGQVPPAQPPQQQ